MNGQILNLKNSDEIYCLEYRKPIKRAAAICPYCEIYVKSLVFKHVKNNQIIVSPKSTENQETKYLMVPFIAIMIFLCMILLTGSDFGYF